MIGFLDDAKAKALLPESQERASYLIDDMLDAIAKHNDRRFTYAKSTFENLLQYPSFEQHQELISTGKEILSLANKYWELKHQRRPRE